MVPDRSVVGGVSDVYRFEIRHIDGRVIRVERAYEPVPVAPEEARWHRDAATANMVNMFPGWVWNGPDIPPHKPAFSLLLPDADGRIWVVRPGPGVRQEGGVEDPFTDHGWFRNPLWVDTYMMDVFDRDGRFLGSVDLPAGFRFSPRPVFAHDTVIAYLENAEGTPYVKKFRLVLP
jgi:hypothetical protein